MNSHAPHAEVSIEPAGPEHLAEIAALATIIWRAHYPGIISREQIDYMLARMYDVAVMRRELETGVAYDRLLVKGTLRGFASYGPASDARGTKLHKLYIHPDFQRHRLGGTLLRHVESVASSRGFTQLVLSVNKRNETAIAAYLKNGFNIRESVVTDIGGGFVMDDYMMVKRIA